MVVEAIGALLVTVLGVAATLALVFGLMGVVGAVAFLRCPACGHVAVGGRARPPYCLHCKRLQHVHPLSVLHHPNGRQPVRPDRRDRP